MQTWIALMLITAPADHEIREPKTGVTFVWSDESKTAPHGDGKIVCGPPYREEVDAAMPRIQQIFSFYGADVLKQARVKGVRFCRDLTWRFGRPVRRKVEGAIDVRTEQGVGGLAVYQESRIYVDVASALRGGAIDGIFHHELFHFIDRVLVDRAFERDWAAANPPKFRYGGTGFDQMGGAVLLPGEYPGFVTPYARASSAEDRAELFSWWLSKRSRLQALLKDDAVLRKKTELLRRQFARKLTAFVRRLPTI